MALGAALAIAAGAFALAPGVFDAGASQARKARLIPATQERPRIVSLNPCTDAILVEVADPAQILALSHYSHDPRSSSIDLELARRFRATGGSAEEVIALSPDVVLASAYASPALRSALARLGMRVELFGIAQDFAASEAQIRRIAQLAGRPARGEALIARMREARARAAAQRPQGAPPSALLWQPGQIVAGRRSLVHQLLETAGFASHAASRSMAQGQYLALEEVLADPPQILLVAGDSAGQRHRALDRLSATRVEPFDPHLLYCAGPTVIRALDRLSAIRRSVK